MEMGGVSRYFSKVSGSRVDLTLLTCVVDKSHKRPLLPSLAEIRERIQRRKQLEAICARELELRQAR